MSSPSGYSDDEGQVADLDPIAPTLIKEIEIRLAGHTAQCENRIRELQTEIDFWEEELNVLARWRKMTDPSITTANTNSLLTDEEAERYREYKSQRYPGRSAG